MLSIPMSKVAIVTDTTACIPARKVREYGIAVVPVELIIDNKTYRDGIDISPARFYALLRKADKLPTTVGALPGHYLEVFRRVSKEASGILCITEPVHFSGMFNSARLAVGMAKEELPGVAIEVLGGATAAAGMGLVVLAAARAAASGADLAAVVGAARDVMPRVSLFAMLDTLYYLVKSGRVPRAAALANSLLKIKPVFTLDQGDARTVALPRSIPNAMTHIVRFMRRNVVKGKPVHAAVMHADALENALKLKNQIASHFSCAELFVTEFTPVMGLHTGPGLFGVAFYSGD